MRRFLLGDESRFVESAVGRITLCVLFTVLVAAGLTLLFVLPARFSPFLLKFVVIIGMGLAASFITRRLLAHRSAALRTVTAIFACIIALAVLSPLTLGFVGLNLLRSYVIATPLDAGIQLLVAGLAVAAGQAAWAPSRRTVMVEPRETVDVTLTAPPPNAARGRVRTTASPQSPAPRSRWASFVSRFITPPATRTRTRTIRSAKPARKRSARGAGITLSAREQHVCPYCLEPVTKNDRRGVKICKICKTWHHADCWEITGVCQVPHAYQN
ncbi:MAG TPA: hypothetical protein PLC52_09890 [Anaerolineales bacterium]|nr:hypothetical protein [Anaerolineales bacterium]HRQ93161.1 hypothetical protein [Anaerolineales bacterium]